jgi:hypothetical protein
MERTVLPEVLHLQVRSIDLAKEHSDLLLCDMSGEDFREAKDSMEVCQSMQIIRRADTFVLLIDGAKLVDPASRQRAKNDPLTLLRNCLDGQMLRPETAVDVLFTKWDLVLASDEKTDIEAFSKVVEASIGKQFAGRVKSLRVARIAAHPSEGDLPLGYGLKDSFQSWANYRAQQISEVMPTPTGKTVYDRFLGRNHNAIGEALLSTVIDAIDIAAADSLFKAVPGLLVTILRRNSARAAVPSLWSDSFDHQREYFDAATTGRDLPAERRR